MLALPLVVLIMVVAGCASGPGPRHPAAAPAATPVTSPPPAPSPTPTSSLPYFPPGPVCQAYAISLAAWQQAGAAGDVTLATFTRFARELHAEAKLAADDQPLGTDLQVASRVVAADGKTGAAGGTVNTTVLAGDLENVKLDCGQF